MNLEHELDATTKEPTGRTRWAQFKRTMRWQAVPPSRVNVATWSSRSQRNEPR
jgi:hypothetical protein